MYVKTLERILNAHHHRGAGGKRTSIHIFANYGFVWFMEACSTDRMPARVISRIILYRISIGEREREREREKEKRKTPEKRYRCDVENGGDLDGTRKRRQEIVVSGDVDRGYLEISRE